MLVVGRIVSSISVGIASAIVPLYQSEITEPRIRGRIVSMQQWYVSQGALNIETVIQTDIGQVDHLGYPPSVLRRVWLLVH